MVGLDCYAFPVVFEFGMTVMTFYTSQRKSPGETVITSLDKLCLRENLCDVYFIFPSEDNTRIPAHKLILAMRSPSFKTMFYGCFSRKEEEIKILDMKSDIFKIMLRYLYTDQLELNVDIVVPLLYAAQKYELLTLGYCCEVYLMKCTNTNNVCTNYGRAISNCLKSLEKSAVQFISEHTEEVFQSEDFLSLSSENLSSLLRIDSLSIPEVTVFNCVMKWVDNYIRRISTQFTCRKSRRDVLLQDGILYQIRFPLLSLEEFTECVIPSDILTDEEQLQIFKAISMQQSCLKFRNNPRAGCRAEIRIDQLIFPNAASGFSFGKANTFNKSETIHLKSSKPFKICGITINPKYSGPVPQNAESVLKCLVNGHVTENRCYQHGTTCKLKLNENVVTQNEYQIEIGMFDNSKPNGMLFNLKSHYNFEQTDHCYGSHGTFGPLSNPNAQWHEYVIRRNTVLNIKIEGAWLVDSFVVT